MSRVIG